MNFEIENEDLNFETENEYLKMLSKILKWEVSNSTQWKEKDIINIDTEGYYFKKR